MIHTAVIVMTPVSRRDLFSTVRENVMETLDGFDWKWLVMEDGPKTTLASRDPRISHTAWNGATKPTFGKHGAPKYSHVGHPLRNRMLDMTEKWDGLVIHLDDDNLLHPRLPGVLRDYSDHAAQSGCLGLTVSQEYRSGVPRLRFNREEPLIDTGCMFFQRSAIGTTRFRIGSKVSSEDWYRADQYFFRDVYTGRRDRILDVSTYASYYNALTEETGQSWVKL